MAGLLTTVPVLCIGVLSARSTTPRAAGAGRSFLAVTLLELAPGVPAARARTLDSAARL